MTNGKSKMWFLLTVVFAVCLTIFTLSYIVITPWHVITDIGGDGGKNIFTYLYESMYGKGVWFEGMNYPYGEHILYTDGQPILSFLFTQLKNVTAQAALTVLWLLIGLSYVLSVIYIYKTLIHFKVTPPVALVFAGLISVFTPQIFRISGHYALAYTCVIPMVFYWTVLYYERSLRKYCVYIFTLGVIMAFLHLYFAAMLLIWVLSYVVGYFVLMRIPFAGKVRHALPLLISAFAVFGTVAIVMKITDPIKDRPAIPYGILSYTTHRKDIVTSPYSPVWIYIRDHHIFTRISERGEGYVYIGVVAIIVVLLSLIIGTIKLGKDRAGIIVSKQGFSPIWLFVAFSALLFSMGVPFIWHMEKLLNYMSFLRQFRTLGRFSWIFYYIITVYSVVVISTWFKNLIAKRKSFLAYATLLFPMIVWSYEASGYIKYSRSIAAAGTYYYEVFFAVNEQNWESFLEGHQYKKNDFQALLLLPFFHVGTEKIWIDGDWVSSLGFKASLQLHLPIIDVKMSRSSWSLAEKQVKIAGGPFVDKPILNDLKSNKPFLLLHFEDDSLDRDQKYLLESADYIGHYSQCNVYAFYPDRLAANQKKIADSIKNDLSFMRANDSCIINRGPWYVNHLDEAGNANHIFGVGAMGRISGNDSNILAINIHPLADSQQYEFSCWFLLDNKDYSSPYVNLEFLDSAGKVIETVDAITKLSVDNYDMWFRASVYFPMRANCSAVRCRLENDPNPSYIMMDEIMLRPADALIISKGTDGSVMVNNHLFEKPTLPLQKK